VVVYSNSPKDTENLAKKIASLLQGNEILALYGDLGAGKTAFTRGFADFFGLKDEVSSPTFSLVNEYEGTKFKIYHFDMYRISDASEVYEIGFNEYLNKANAIVLIEWYEKIASVLKGDFVKITINKIDENSREFIFEKVTL